MKTFHTPPVLLPPAPAAGAARGRLPSRLPRLALIALLALCFAVPAGEAAARGQEPAKPAVAQSASDYRRLVELVKKGDLTVDFVKLRDAFSEWSGDEKNRVDAATREAMVEAFNRKDYAKAAELVEVVLDYEFVHRGLHLAAEDAHRRVGNEAKADFHRDVARKLLAALLSTGDGKTPETAYRVHTIREEYLIMEERGIKVSSQSLVTAGERVFDVLAGDDKKTGRHVEVYFDITKFFGGGKNKE
jgi:hypothetical protein